MTTQTAHIEHQVLAIKQGDDDRHTYRIPALIADQNGQVWLFCEGRRESSNDEATIDLIVQKSGDHGKTWSKPSIVVSGGTPQWTFAGNPSPIYDAKTGHIVVLFTTDNQQLWSVISTNNGQSWSDPINHNQARDAFQYSTVRIATGPGHAIIMTDGTWVAPIWLSDRLRKDQDQDSTLDRHRDGVILSRDFGKSWAAGGLVPANLNRLHECTVVELPSGALLMNIRVRGAGYRASSLSFDGGLSWQAPKLETALPCPTCHASMLNLPCDHIALCNPAVYHPTPYSTEHRRNLTLSISCNEGLSWTKKWVIDPKWSGYSDLALSADGHLICAYECGENDYREGIKVVRIPLHILS